MKKALSCCVIVFCLALVPALSKAESEACHDPMHGQMDGQAEESMFKNMDSNGDGVVSRDEFNAFYAKRFAELDVNKGGNLTVDEIKGGIKNPMGDRMSSGMTHLNERFSAADVNHDGGLDREEAKAMPLLSMYFEEVDTNHDGKVTRQEYFDAMPLLHQKHPVKQEKTDSF